MSEPFEDKNHVFNSSKYYSGKECVETGCKEPAGTAWSSLWCFKHNSERMKKIDAGLNKLVNLVRTNL